MSEIINAEINLTKLNLEEVAYTTKQGDKYVKCTVIINDTLNDYNKNVSIIRQQSEEERKSKQKPFYLGTGLSIWKDGSITNFLKEIKDKKNQQSNNSGSDDLPF